MGGGAAMVMLEMDMQTQHHACVGHCGSGLFLFLFVAGLGVIMLLVAIWASEKRYK